MRLLRRSALPPLLALALVGIAPQASSARPWTATYDWNATSTTGYENWAVEETAPDSGQPLPFYRAYLGGAPGDIGRGLVLQPLGGRVYGNGNAASQEGGPGVIVRWNAPGQSRITRAAYGNTKYRNERDGQYMRARVTGSGGQTIDYGPAYDEDDPDRTYVNPAPPFDRTSTAGTTAEFWLFTVCGPDQANPGSFACPNVPAGTGTFARVGTVNLTLDDPDQPVIAVESSPTIDDGWVNKRRTQRLTVTAADPSSGISRIRVQVRAGGATTGGRTLSDTNVTCDAQHRTSGRGGLVCPPSATATATDPGSSQTAGDRTYVITAWDYAGNQSVTTQTVRRDTEVPSRGDASGAELRDLTNGWTNRVGQVPVRLTGEDSRAGVARLQLLARRVASGRATELADTTTSCNGDCRRAAETVNATLDRTTLPQDGRYRIEVRVTDRAGNSKTFRIGQTLKVDRQAPERLGPRGRAELAPDGTIRLRFSPGRDAGEASGLGNVVVRYATLPSWKPGIADNALFGAPRLVMVRARVADLQRPETGGIQVKRLQRTMVLRTTAIVDQSQPIEVYVFDRASGASKRSDLLDESGNAREDLVPIQSSRYPWPRRGAPSSSRLPGPPTGVNRARNFEEKSKYKSQGELEADYPGQPNPGSRGTTPYLPDSIRMPSAIKAQEASAAELQLVTAGKNVLLPRDKRLDPWAMMDTWGLYSEENPRATGARIRAVSCESIANTYSYGAEKKGGKGNGPPYQQTQVDDNARRFLDLIKNYVDQNGKPLDAAHLVGASFGGFGKDPRNLIALSHRDNVRMYRRLEKPARDIVLANCDAHFVWYVRAEYTDPKQKYARAIHGWLEITGGRMTSPDRGSRTFFREYTYRTVDFNTIKKK